MATGPSTTTNPYLITLEPNVTLTSLLTTGDTIQGGTAVFGGIPDGIGMFDNGDGTVSVVVGHEYGNTTGLVRDHGSAGSYLDLLTIDKSTLAVIAGEDLIKTVQQFDSTTDSFFELTSAFARLCSGDLAEQSAFQFGGLGTGEKIYLTGEETGAEGRAFATVVTGDDTGVAFELAYLGNMSFENVVANPFAQEKTIVASTFDGGGGPVYIYVGDKQSTGNDVEKAGLVGGKLFGIAVEGFANETDATPVSGTFTLAEIGPDGDASDLSGGEIAAEAALDGVTGFERPEDSAWDPQNPNVLYMATTNGFNQPSRLYKFTFIDITNPQLGGTVEAVLDGTEGQQMFDNISVGNGKVFLQEDPGGNAYLAQVYEYDIASDTLTAQLQFDPAQFTPGLEGFITSNEESSGIIDVSGTFGDDDTRAYLLDAQVHSGTGDPATVERGQLLLMTIDDVVNKGSNADETLNGDAAANTIRGAGGDDVIRGGSGNDNLFGDNKDDTIEGGAGNDILKGGNGADTLNGGEGDDALWAGRGDDVMTGGAGADVFRFQNFNMGDNVITDFDIFEDSLALSNRNGIVNELHGDYNDDGFADTLLMLENGTITLLGVDDYPDFGVVI